MRAVAVTPRVADTARLIEVPEPRLASVPDGRGVLVRVIRVGLDGTDRDIYAGSYGAAPAGDDYLITGHEGLGIVEEVGSAVTELRPGDLVVAIVRRPGGSRYDQIGYPDFTTDDVYYEHGISRLHGFLTERYVDTPEYLIRVPGGLANHGVLLEPSSVVEKGIAQAFEIQRRLHLWEPRRAAVLGTGPLGLLAVLFMRLRGLEVIALGLEDPPYRNSDLVNAVGARYVSTRATSLTQIAGETGSIDLIFEATGFSPLVFEAMRVVGKDGVLVLSSVTGGDRTVEVPADAINLSFVLGNKVAVGTVNASRENFEAAVRDIAVADAQWPGWLDTYITHRVDGLERFADAYQLLSTAKDAIKIVIEVARPAAA